MNKFKKWLIELSTFKKIIIFSFSSSVASISFCGFFSLMIYFVTKGNFKDSFYERIVWVLSLLVLMSVFSQLSVILMSDLAKNNDSIKNKKRLKFALSFSMTPLFFIAIILFILILKELK